MIQKPRMDPLKIINFVRRLIFSLLYTIPCKKIQHHECLRNYTRRKWIEVSYLRWTGGAPSYAYATYSHYAQSKIGLLYTENRNSASFIPSNLHVRTSKINELIKLIIN